MNSNIWIQLFEWFEYSWQLWTKVGILKLLKDGCDKKEFLSQVKDSQKMAKMINDGVDEQEVYDAFSKNITKENKIELSKVIDSLKDRKHALQCQAEAVKEKNKIIEDKKKKKQRKMKEKNVAVERKAGEVPGPHLLIL